VEVFDRAARAMIGQLGFAGLERVLQRPFGSNRRPQRV
jgi:hypothetical protein